MTGTDFHLAARSSHPEEPRTSSSRKFDKSVLAMTSQNESNKEKKETVGTKVGATAAPPVGGGRARKAANA